MLELIHDNRTGKRLEIVLPALNEEARVTQLARHYAPHFDVVVLDDGSTDATVAQAVAAGATVFLRTVKDVAPEAHFSYYVREETRSGRCFWMLADEFVPRRDLQEIEALLEAGACGVLCRRVNYFYGHEVRTLISIHPRGFRRGAAEFQADDLHSSLCLKAGCPVASSIFAVQHLHVGSLRYFGTGGAYTSTEVAQFRRNAKPRRRFLRRYAVSFGAYVTLKWWREKNLSGAARLFIALERLVILLLASMSWLEQKHLLSEPQQRTQYSRFFADDGLVTPDERLDIPDEALEAAQSARQTSL